MRWSLFSALLVAAGVGVGFSDGFAGEHCTAPVGSCATCDSGCGDSGCCDAGGCGHGKCHGCGHGRGYEGLDRHFNCGCNGSYKFPVPPLYTYHWPGMYSQQLMTDYHSPWRFPPIKPYSDENLKPYPARGLQPADPVGPVDSESLPPAPPGMASSNPQQPSEVQAAEYAAASPKVLPGNAESISDKLKKVSRYAQ